MGGGAAAATGTVSIISRDRADPKRKSRFFEYGDIRSACGERSRRGFEQGGVEGGQWAGLGAAPQQGRWAGFRVARAKGQWAGLRTARAEGSGRDVATVAGRCVVPGRALSGRGE